MIYGLPLLIASMLGYIFWRSAFRLRRDRLETARRSDRWARILTSKHRARLNLGKAFDVSAEKPEWEAALIADLARVEAGTGASEAADVVASR